MVGVLTSAKVKGDFLREGSFESRPLSALSLYRAQTPHRISIPGHMSGGEFFKQCFFVRDSRRIAGGFLFKRCHFSVKDCLKALFQGSEYPVF